MSDPSSYVNFQDFMGLNDEAGQQMLSRTAQEGGDLLYGEANDAAQGARRVARTGGSDEEYGAASDKANKATASYGEFAQSMKDPVARQALMEKIYGKGRVSWMDSALAGGSTGADATIGGQQSRADELKGQTKANLDHWGGRMHLDRDQKAAGEADDARRAASLEAFRGRMKQRDIEDRNRQVDSYARQFDPNYRGGNEMPFDSYGFIDGLIGRKRPEGTQRDYWARQLGRAEATPSMDQSMNTGSNNPANGFNAGEQGNSPQGQSSNIGAFSKSKRWVVGSDGSGRWVGDKKMGDKWGDVRDIYDPNRIKKWGEK